MRRCTDSQGASNSIESFQNDPRNIWGCLTLSKPPTGETLVPVFKASERKCREPPRVRSVFKLRV